MILIDAGPLVAVIDRGDVDHELCMSALYNLPRPLVTTWPAFTEAMYLLGRRGGWKGQRALWTLVSQQDLLLAELDEQMRDRATRLMEQYHDLPMDLADATLVALAEARGLTQIVTLDADFGVYRLRGRKAFKVIP